MSSPATTDDKEQKRRKQLKRMNKILANAWKESDDSFQDGLATIGQKLDANEYRFGKHGWEDFSKDLGGVYNYHVHK